MIISKKAASFVPRTVFPDYNLVLSNFKGHHQKALTKFGHLAPQIDLILEVRDSRAPISTTNVLFDKVLAHKRKIVLYSKKDLSIIKPHLLRKWHKNEDFLFVDTRKRSDARRILEAIKQQYDLLLPPPPLGLRTMIIGMPNVGKSSLVNTLREEGLTSKDPTKISNKKRKVARTGGQPGVTRNTSEIIRLSRDPNILVYDTPGVFLPSVKDSQTMLALGMAGCIHTSFIDPIIQADYLLYILNLQDPSGQLYANYLPHPTNNVHELLYWIAKGRNKIRGGTFDELGMAIHFVNIWRQGDSPRHRALFDVNAIVESDAGEISNLQDAEMARLETTSVRQRIADSMGHDGTGLSKERKRTAKDREADMRNQLFKL